MDDSKAGYQATPSATLEQQMMDACAPKNEREWWASEEIARLRAEVDALKAEDARLRKTWQKENDELVQILGKALQYPRFVDDQSVFPGATEADGVCIGDHVAASLACEAADMIAKLQGEVEALRVDAERYRFVRIADGIRISLKAARDPVVYDAAIDAARAAQEVSDAPTL